MPLKNEIIEQLEKIPGWSGLTAYGRAKHCCAELAKRGEKIPSWIVIRNLIGKGSSNDINRAKEDFRQEQGATLRKMTGFTDGMPDAIANHVHGLWLAAIDYSDTKFEAQAKALQEQINLSAATVSEAESARDLALARAAELTQEVANLTDICDSLKINVTAERMGRERAEHLLESSQMEIANQKEKLMLALDNAQKELGGAIARLEGAENHALMEAERVRSDYLKKIESLEAAYAKEKIKTGNTIAQMESKLQNQATNTVAAQQKIFYLEKEISNLAARLQRSELLVDKLTEENSRLIAAIGEPKAS